MIVDSAKYRIYLDEDDKRPTFSASKTSFADTIHCWDGIPDDWPLEWRTRKTKHELPSVEKKSTRILHTSC